MVSPSMLPACIVDGEGDHSPMCFCLLTWQFVFSLLEKKPDSSVLTLTMNTDIFPKSNSISGAQEDGRLGEVRICTKEEMVM